MIIIHVDMRIKRGIMCDTGRIPPSVVEMSKIYILDIVYINFINLTWSISYRVHHFNSQKCEKMPHRSAGIVVGKAQEMQ